MKVIDLAIADGTFPMPAHIVGLLAVHRILKADDTQGQTFVITHVSSGKLICRVGKFPESMKVARALMKLKGWDRKDDEIVRDKVFAARARKVLTQHGIQVSWRLNPAPERGMR